MDLKAMRQRAREKLKGYCRVCPECNGRACAGEMPGMGGIGTGAAFRHNVEALAAVRVNLRTLHGIRLDSVDTRLNLFGRELSGPILAAPMTGMAFNAGGALTEEEWAKAVTKGTLAAGALAMTGDGPDPVMFRSGLDEIRGLGGRGIPIIKPRENEEVFRYIDMAQEAGAAAVGMDIDAAGIIPMARAGQPVSPKTPGELREIIAHSEIPFIVKGIMTVEEAEIAGEAGAAAIVVSNHGGRVLDHTPGSAEVLAKISARVRGQMIVFADGGVRSGLDVLKMLALGADAVLIGRPLLIGAAGAGEEGVVMVLETLGKELKEAMLMTGCAGLSGIGADVLAGVPAAL
ncbi:L-lactate dehydrogenase [Peptococcaceae bacterium CEB3]|nr:L-lactate dehydrogenase [Peptococcaceae bacterium CEB3]